MVHRRNHRNKCFTVGKSENRNFRTGQKFLDDDFTAAFSEFFIPHHGYNGFARFVFRLRYYNALSEREPVRLYNGRQRGFLNIIERGVYIVKSCIAGGGYAVFLHKLF